MSDPPTPDASWSEGQARFLAEAGAALSASLDYRQILVRLGRLAVPTLADWCAVAVVERDGLPRRVALLCADPARQPLADAIMAAELSAEKPYTTYARVIASGETELIDPFPIEFLDGLSAPAGYIALMKELAPRSLLTIPLVVRGRPRGAISFIMAESGRRHDAQGTALAHELARRAAVAVDNALLYADAQRRVAELATVQRVAQAVTSALRLDQICQAVVDQIHGAFGYKLISIYLRDDDALRLQAQVGYQHVLEVIRLDQGASGRVARSGQPVFVRDSAADPEFIAVEPGICQGIIVPLRYADGPVLGTIAVESTGSPHLSEDDLSLLGLLADQISVAVVNARLFARVEESANRFQSLVETAGSVIFCVGPDMRITEFNREAERAFGARRDEVLGTSYLKRFVAEGEREGIVRLARRALRGDPMRPIEWPLRGPDGRERHFVWTIARRTDARGEPAELLVVGQEITEQREAEQARLALERKMLEAQRLESLGLLAGGIAHDFNNLLTATLGNASLLLLDLPPGSEAYHSARQIELVTQRAADLVGQMLAYAGRGRFIVQPLSLNDLVAEMLVLLRVSISKGATLVQHLAPALPPVEGDAAQVRQVVMNLIVNASEAIGEAGGTITIATALVRADAALVAASAALTPGLAPGDYVAVTVEDTGVGMDDATRARIFDPFFTTKFAGRGLGLAAVLGIVRAHQGGLTVDSAPGQGSRFTVLLPARPEAAPARAAPLTARLWGGPVAGAGGPLVLIIDDEDEVRQTAARILERGGYATLSAADGERGVALARDLRQPLAAVLLDLTMARMSGEQVFHALRQLRPGLPVVLMSGYSADEVSGRFGSDAPAAFIQKPFRAPELLELLGRLLGQA